MDAFADRVEVSRDITGDDIKLEDADIYRSFFIHRTYSYPLKNL
jgi:hypothetical protein